MTYPLQFNANLKWWAATLMLLSLLVIIRITLVPFDFAMNNVGASSPQTLMAKLVKPGTPQELVANILLFIPFGFSAAGYLHGRGTQQKRTFAVTLATSFFLSTIIEGCQAFLPLRVTSLYDVMTNTLGGFLGLVVFYRWGVTVLNAALSHFRKRKETLT